MPKPDVSENGPNPVDLHIGIRIRSSRKLAGMSQEALARALKLTFQQVQKYERGANRVGAAKLWEIATHLRAPIAYFFEGLDPHEEDHHSSHEVEVLHAFLLGVEGQALASAFLRIDDAPMRRRMLDLLQALGPPIAASAEVESA